MKGQWSPALGITWRWQWHRALVDRAGMLRPFSHSPDLKRVLFLTEQDDICRAQIFPFFLYARGIAAEHRVELRELPLPLFLQGQHPYCGTVDAVCFQAGFDLTPSEMISLTQRIGAAWPGAKLAYLDWFAPTDLRYAEVLTPHVAVYVKKQTLKDVQKYDDATLGDTNLTDFYAKRFGIDLPETRFPVPPAFWRKLVLGSGFEYSPQIVPHLGKPPVLQGREIDLHARIATAGTEWYEKMRGEAKAAAASLEGRFRVAHRGRVSRRQYLTELRRSKLCFSPFGYGEICWRDFEAMSTGALLLKPDVSHLRLANDIFRPFETYVPLAWDLSDLAEKVEYYVRRRAERKQIAARAFDLLSKHHRDARFVQDISPLWRLLGIT